ncbi:MAG: mannitol dehydrogenase family protein [Pseudoruegeria sp.]
MKLSEANLPHIPQRSPNYDRNAVQTGIVHLGIGAFHRAHQAVFVDDLLAEDPTWGIVGASLRTTATAQALNPQNGLYTLVVRTGTTEEVRIIGSVTEVMVSGENPSDLIAKMVEPNVRIVSLTITEKGYCHRRSTGGADLDHPDIQYDISNPYQPRSAAGMIVAALRVRKANGIGPFSVMSCDNLPNNGAIARQVVLDLAQFIDPVLAHWIETQVTFPATMVDRIVPATTSDDRAHLTHTTGILDAAPVVSEPFCQWVVEDNFCAGRPAFETVGVIMTQDVHPFESMKLRLLNGAHSCIAYAGLRRGHSTVAQAVRDKVILKQVRDLWSETTATLVPPQGVDLDVYTDALILRFQNEALHHELLQIASDGSQKLPQRVLDPIRDRISTQQPFIALARIVSDWLSIVTHKTAAGFTFPLSDPLQAILRPKNGTVSSMELLNVSEVFGADLASSEAFHSVIQGQLVTTED